MSDVSNCDESLLRCLESLDAMVSIVAVVIGSLGYMSADEAKSFERAAGRYNAAKQDLMRLMGGEGDGGDAR